MDVVFEEVVELVGEGVDGAVEGGGDVEGEGEGEAGFVAGGERDVLEGAGCWGRDVLARFTGGGVRTVLQ